ncbi:unnamed protein product [Durusdinium trenchii]|uniref:Uncharacterized protein n=1 Tax=Durusdinium trenchii TaxID=1381693 RepID=A0ABP0JUT2_9DINO
MAAGRVNSVFYAGLAGSWLGQVPGVILCISLWRKDLYGIYTGVAAGYGLLVLLYSGIVLCLDWDKVVEEAQLRSETTKPDLTMSMQPTNAENDEEQSPNTNAA